jgi:hypothetical protein
MSDVVLILSILRRHGPSERLKIRNAPHKNGQHFIKSERVELAHDSHVAVQIRQGPLGGIIRRPFGLWLGRRLRHPASLFTFDRVGLVENPFQVDNDGIPIDRDELRSEKALFERFEAL